MSEVLSLKNVEKVFKDNNHMAFKAVDDVSFSLERGKTLALVGESGCGKSTIARLICRLTDVSAGSIFFEGKEISTLKGKALKNYRQNVQIIFQEPYNAFSKRMRIVDYMIEPHLNFFNSKRQLAIDQAVTSLEHVGLDASILQCYSGELSGGQLQRVTIARAISLQPKIIIFDESTSALDVSIQKQVLDLIVALKEEYGFSAIFITHDLALAESLSDKIYVMYKGQIVEEVSDDIVKNSQHPYTRKLIDAVINMNDSPEMSE